MPPSPHDALFKASFGQPDIARSELALILPPAVRAHLDLGTLTVCPGSFVDEALQQTHTDLLYAVGMKEGGEALVYVLFEHQSSPDGRMPLRLLRYLVRVWERWLRDHPQASKVPIVLPVVLHHGEGRWQTGLDLGSMLDASAALIEAARPYQPHFRFILDDLSSLSLEALAARTLHALGRLVQLALRSSRSMERLQRASPLMGAIAGALERDARTRALLVQLYGYLWRAAPADIAAGDIQSILLSIAGPQGGEDVMNAAEQLIAQGRAEGIQRGRADGLEQGRADGLERGRADGVREAILRVIAARSLPLTAPGQARLAACMDMETLTEWLQRAVTAASEAEVFAGFEEP